MMTPEVEAFLETFQTLMMASLTPQGEAHASTAPFVRFKGHFYILISTVAQHGRNLLVTSQVSLLFAEDEVQSLQPFARKRITLDAGVSEVSRDSERFGEVSAIFSQKFDPDLVSGLLQMGDFHLFELTPRSGNAVMGFGRAYRLNDKLEVVTPVSTGHTQRGSHG